DFLRGGSLTGGRGKASIQRVITENMGAFREAYNKRSREKPGLGGEITVAFVINESGKVEFARVAESTMGDAVFERTVVNKVGKLRFDEGDRWGGRWTDATHRFVFIGGYGWNSKAEEALAERERRLRAKKEREAAERERLAKALREREERERARRELERLRERVIGRNMHKDAVEAAVNIRKWWNTDFTRTAQKYPPPDEKDSDGGAGSRECFKDKAYFEDTTAGTETDYQLYLKLREKHAASPEFYFDAANWFFARGDRETALRVLTSIADLELENAVNYRMLGYRLKEHGEYALQKYVCRKVLRWRPMELQSYLEYALALADNGEAQAALDSLCSMLKRPLPETRSDRPGIGEVAVTEINRLIAKNPRLNTSKVDKRLLTNIASDIRVVIRWNTDDVNVNLAVRDPGGKWCYRYQFNWSGSGTGGRLSDDVRNGYGPEQFMLKKAAKGRYLICVNYQADTRPVDELTTVMVEIYKKYAGKAEQREVVCRRLQKEPSPADWFKRDFLASGTACAVAEIVIE
ncbi:MAG: AgmX/PglI C-terminal domain-containing protein, partial [Chitinispirillales bacterium]|nr:AgmX/PglI C-terminal domain-containing protein [Chitinispirillales bacterium]